LRPVSERSTPPKHDARRRYVELGVTAVLQQIAQDARREIALGPFARLDANAVAAQDGKTRGAITNLFGSQAAFQAETMALALSAGGWIERIEYPAPEDHATADEWVDAFFAGESARGPQHGGTPVVGYGMLWAVWLSSVPYGLWSEEVARPGMEEHVQLVRQLEGVFARALVHFGLSLREGTTLTDLAGATASLVEGVWLNQCLTDRHPSDPSEPIATVLLRGGRLLWRGAVESS
jgi:hypothetical protein